MRPLTDRCPKPLLEIAGKPLISRHLEALACAGVREVVINLHHLGEMIEARVGDGSEFGLTVRYSREPKLLETAGGIKRALDQLGTAPFIVVAGDTLTDFDFSKLPADLGDDLGHLVMVDNPDHHSEGDFELTSGGRLRLVDGGSSLTFSGIAVYSPALFDGVVPNVSTKLRVLFDAAIAEGRFSGQHFAGPWSDVGTPQRLAELDGKLGQ